MLPELSSIATGSPSGAEYRQDFKQQQSNYDQQPYVLYLNNNGNSKNAAYYFQDQFSMRKNLILVGGLRSDWYDTFGTTYNPRFALVYAPTQRYPLEIDVQPRISRSEPLRGILRQQQQR